MRVTHFALLASLSVACASAPRGRTVTVLAARPRLGSAFAPPAIATTVLGQHVYHVRVANALFAVSVDASTSRVTTISTRDPHFRSPEGVSVGLSVSALANDSAKWHSVPAVGCLFVLPSGWRAIVSSGTPASGQQPVTSAAALPAPESATPIAPVATPTCPPMQGAVSQLTLDDAGA